MDTITNHNFSTDVSIEFELLDVKTGLVAYLWNRTSGFVETSMANAGGQKYTLTLPVQTNGATITVACKFAYAGECRSQRTLHTLLEMNVADQRLLWVYKLSILKLLVRIGPGQFLRTATMPLHFIQ
jgi:hypothetical protein